ncbi:MAG: IclR family transcriptional regulator [Sulfitobacter sp.]
MSSATKTLALLSHFSATLPEIGLSQLCKLANRDKATTYRHLQALEDAGFVEKNPLTKRYRLGPALLSLAQMREVTVPRKAGVIAPLKELADATGETAHVSILSGGTLYSLDVVESPEHSTRAIVSAATHPLHATASGICALAFSTPDLTDIAKKNLKAFTAQTPTTEQEIDAAIQHARATGYGHSDGSLDNEVHSRSVPIFDQTGLLAGTVSVACVATRFTSKAEQEIKRHLITASRQISHNWGGTVPSSLEACWLNASSKSQQMEPAS